MRKPPVLFALLAEPIRWRLVQALAESDRLIQELARQVGQPLNLISYHLRQLREAGLITERRSSLDARATYCSLDLDRLAELHQDAGRVLHPALAAQHVGARPGRPLSVLFLCTHNAARSQMAEGLLRVAVEGLWLVASAGNQPSGVHPLAIKTLAQRGIDIRHHTSKDPAALDVREYDVVISLCDRVRAERIDFPNRPRRVHWSLADPLASPKRAQSRVFRETADGLNRRIDWLLRQLGESTRSDSSMSSRPDA